MAFTYTDSDKIVLEAWGKFKVTLLEAVEPGDLLSWYNTDNDYTVQHADESDSQRADCIAVDGGAVGAEITACLKAVLGTISTIATGGVVTRVYFAGADDFFGAPLYLDEDGKPGDTAGTTLAQKVGILLARDRILVQPEVSPEYLGNLILGVDDHGADLTVYGDTADKRLTWDASADQLQVRGSAKFHNRPLTTNTFAIECKADFKASSGTFTGAFQNTVRSYPTTDTTAAIVIGADFNTELHSGDAMTAGYLIGITCKAHNDGTMNGAGIIVTPQWNLLVAGGTWTKVSHLAALWLDSHMTVAPTAGHFELLYMTNNAAGQMGNAIYIYGNDKITSFFDLVAVSGMVTTTSSGGGTRKYKVRCNVDGVAGYMSLFTD